MAQLKGSNYSENRDTHWLVECFSFGWRVQVIASLFTALVRSIHGAHPNASKASLAKVHNMIHLLLSSKHLEENPKNPDVTSYGETQTSTGKDCRQNTPIVESQALMHWRTKRSNTASQQACERARKRRSSWRKS